MAEQLRAADTTDPKDLAALADLRQAWSAEGERDDQLDDPALDELAFHAAFVAWVSSQPRTFYLAVLDGREVGMLNVLTYQRMPRPGGASSTWGYLANAFVRPAFRGAGVGSRLLGVALADCERRGHVRVVLSPSPRSVPFYARAGFAAAEELMIWRPTHP